MRAWLSRPRTGFDWLLIWLAVAYFAVVAIWDFGSSVRASADALGDGEVWTLFTSSLEVDGGVPALQLLLTALIAAAVIVREGPRLWWVVALVGHVGSALIAYGIIGLAELLDSASADRVADDPDYGVSCVLAASFGALAVSGYLAIRREEGANGGGPAAGLGPMWDRVALFAGLLGIAGLLPLSFGWYGLEHPISYVLGATVAAIAIRRRTAR